MQRDRHGSSLFRTEVAALPVLAVLAAAASAQGFETDPFGTPQTLEPTISKLAYLAAGDLDGDGLPDLVVRAFDEQHVMVFINDAGTFGAGIGYSSPLSGLAFPLWRQLLADLDGDGALDVVVGDSVIKQVQTLLNHGDGTFEAGAPAGSLTANTRDMDAADMDGDGVRDLAACVGGLIPQGELMLLHGHGDGTFGSPEQVGTPKPAVQLQIADLDGDDALDVVLQSGVFDGGGQIGFSVFRGVGDGTFVPEPFVFATGLLMGYGFEVADLDVDGQPDILAATPDQALVTLGHGDGSFGPLQAIDIHISAVSLVVSADVDADGYPDFVGGGSAFAQRLGPGVGLVGAPEPIVGLELGQPHLTAADFDGDALPDLAWVGSDDRVHVALDVLGPFIDVGYDSPPGQVTLSVEGTPLAGAAGTLLVGGPHPGTPAVLVVGLHPVHAGFAGLDLVPDIGALLPAIVGTPIHGRWPETLQPGTLLYFQAFAAEPVPALSQAIVVVPE